MASRRYDDFDVYQDAAGEWRWRQISRNNKIVADSAEGYSSFKSAERAAFRESEMDAPYWTIPVAFALGVLVGLLLAWSIFRGHDKTPFIPTPARTSTTLRKVSTTTAARPTSEKITPQTVGQWSTGSSSTLATTP